MARNLTTLSDTDLKAELERRALAAQESTQAGLNRRAEALTQVAPILVDGADWHDSRNGKAWNGAYVKVGEFQVGGRTVTASITFTDVEATASLKRGVAKGA